MHALLALLGYTQIHLEPINDLGMNGLLTPERDVWLVFGSRTGTGTRRPRMVNATGTISLDKCPCLENCHVVSRCTKPDVVSHTLVNCNYSLTNLAGWIVSSTRGYNHRQFNNVNSSDNLILSEFVPSHFFVSSATDSVSFSALTGIACTTYSTGCSCPSRKWFKLSIHIGHVQRHVWRL